MKLRLTQLLLATFVLFTPLRASAQESCIPFGTAGEMVCYSGVFPANPTVIELGQPIRLPATVLKNLTKQSLTFRIEWAGIDVAGSGLVDQRQLAPGETATLNDLAFEIDGLDLGTRKIAIGFSTIGAYQFTTERPIELTVVVPGKLREIIQIPLRYCVVEGSQQAQGHKPGEKVDGKRLLANLREASDTIWLPQAGVLFRHAFAPRGIPVIADPEFDPAKYELGVLTMTGFFDGEWGRAVDNCEQAWKDNYPDEQGIVIVNARRLIPEVALPVAGVAPGVPLALQIGGTRGDALCGNPRNLTAADVTKMLRVAHFDPAMF
jgi:hypothetical protein